MSTGQVGVVDIVTFLLREYIDWTAQTNGEPREKVKDRIMADGGLMAFRNFAFNYLTNYRPSAITHAEANFIIQLTNGKTTAVCPGAESLRGTMQPSSYIPVTGRETAQEIMANATGMRGHMTPMGGPVDLTQNQGMKRYDL
jgi:hypothetical protein